MTENHAQAENAAISSRPAPTCCCHRKETPRSEELQADLHRRLNRVIGQLGGIKKMVEEDRYCVDIANQLLATQSILKKANQQIIHAHMRSCVREALEGQNEAEQERKVEEMLNLMDKLTK